MNTVIHINLLTRVRVDQEEQGLEWPERSFRNFQ